MARAEVEGGEEAGGKFFSGVVLGGVGGEQFGVFENATEAGAGGTGVAAATTATVESAADGAFVFAGAGVVVLTVSEPVCLGPKGAVVVVRSVAGVVGGVGTATRGAGWSKTTGVVRAGLWGGLVVEPGTLAELCAVTGSLAAVEACPAFETGAGAVADTVALLSVFSARAHGDA